MASIADLTAQVAALQTTANAILAKPAPVPPVATQDELDALGGGLAAVQDTLSKVPLT